MYCPNCGTENKEGSIYCNLCQEPLQKYSGAPPMGQPPMGQPPMGQPPMGQPPMGQPPMGQPMAPPPGPVPGPPPQSPLVPPGEGFGQGGPPPPPYGGAPYPTQGPAFQAGPGNQQPYPAYPAYPGYPPQYQGYPGQQGYSPYPVVIAQTAATPGEATASLVLGIIGIFICPIVCSILAIVYGIKAKNMIDASGGYMGGRGVAQAGLVLGIVGMVLYTILVIVSLATNNFNTSMLALTSLMIMF